MLGKLCLHNSVNYKLFKATSLFTIFPTSVLDSVHLVKRCLYFDVYFIPLGLTNRASSSLNAFSCFTGKCSSCPKGLYFFLYLCFLCLSGHHFNMQIEFS